LALPGYSALEESEGGQGAPLRVRLIQGPAQVGEIVGPVIPSLVIGGGQLVTLNPEQRDRRDGPELGQEVSHLTYKPFVLRRMGIAEHSQSVVAVRSDLYLRHRLGVGEGPGEGPTDRREFRDIVGQCHRSEVFWVRAP